MNQPSDPARQPPVPSPGNSLRQRAEELLREQGVEDFAQDITPALVKVVEELRIHQVELEIQNETLQIAQSWQQASETRFRHLYDLTPIGYLIMDRNGRILHANPAACACFKQSAKHMKHSVFPLWIDPAMAGTLTSHLRDVFARENAFSCELKLREKDRWIRIDSIQDPRPPMDLLAPAVSGSSLHNAVHQTTCLSAIIDITDQKLAEQKLTESLAFHSTVINSMAYGFAVINAETYKIEMANDTFGGMEAVGRTCHEVTHKSPVPCNDEQHPCPIQEVRRTGKPALANHLHYDKDGRECVFEVHAHPIFDREHRVTRIIEQCIDITDRKRIEAQLAESEHHFRTLFAESPISMIIHDKDTGAIIDANRAAWTSYGLTSLADFRQHPIWEDSPYSQDEAIANIQHCAADGQQVFEWMSRRQSGELFWEQIHLQPLWLDGHLRVLATCSDITNQKRVNDQLQRTKGYLENLIHHANAPIIVWDADYAITLFNFAFQQLTGIPELQALGHPLSILFPNESAGHSMQRIRASTGKNWDREEFLIANHKTGAARTVLWNSAPIHDPNGQVIATIAQGVDVTDQRRTEENLRHMEKMSAIGQLAGGIAHNFNNQLTGVIGYAHMLQAAIQDPKLRGYVDKLLTGARRSAELTKQMLSFARMEAGEFKPVNLHDIVHESISMLEHTLPSNITIRQHLHAAIPHIEADASQIQNAILNLAINARDAMPKGGELLFETSVVNLNAAYCRHLPDPIPTGRYLRLAVTDTGGGIEKENLSRIFDPFFTTKPPGEGTGMGLSTVYGTIKLHKGTIHVYSEPGHGTTFTIYLPLKPEVGEHEIPVQEMTRATKPATILLVDDDEIVRSLAKDILNDMGYKVEVCCDGTEGLAFHREHAEDIDLVILDVVMPGMNGTEVFEEMQRTHPDVRVIFASGYSVNGIARDLLDGEARCFVQKPFDPHVLSETVAQMLADL